MTVIGSEKYNSLSNGMTQYPVVADPDGFDLNQLYVAYASDAVSSRLGRQRINHDRQRFVGGVAWRQNEQSLDAVRFQFGDSLKLDYSWASRVNRIFGPDDGVQPRQWDSNSHFLRGAFSPAKGHTLVAFGYLMDFENGNGAPNSNSTFGIEYKGKVGAVQLAAALAQQSDYADSALDYDAPYYFVEAKYAAKQFGMTRGYEVLGSDDGVAGFRTPLATLHKFQGWADMCESNSTNVTVRSPRRRHSHRLALHWLPGNSSRRRSPHQLRDGHRFAGGTWVHRTVRCAPASRWAKAR